MVVPTLGEALELRLCVPSFFRVGQPCVIATNFFGGIPSPRRATAKHLKNLYFPQIAEIERYLAEGGRDAQIVIADAQEQADLLILRTLMREDRKYPGGDNGLPGVQEMVARLEHAAQEIAFGAAALQELADEFQLTVYTIRWPMLAPFMYNGAEFVKGNYATFASDLNVPATIYPAGSHEAALGLQQLKHVLQYCEGGIPAYMLSVDIVAQHLVRRYLEKQGLHREAAQYGIIAFSSTEPQTDSTI